MDRGYGRRINIQVFKKINSKTKNKPVIKSRVWWNQKQAMDKTETSSVTVGILPIYPVIKKTMKWGNSDLAERLTFRTWYISESFLMWRN